MLHGVKYHHPQKRLFYDHTTPGDHAADESRGVGSFFAEKVMVSSKIPRFLSVFSDTYV